MHKNNETDKPSGLNTQCVQDLLKIPADVKCLEAEANPPTQLKGQLTHNYDLLPTHPIILVYTERWR